MNLKKPSKAVPVWPKPMSIWEGSIFNGGIWKGAFNLNREAIKIRPRFSVPHGNLGFAYLQQGDIESAVESLEKAMAINPQFVQALATLGSAYFMQGRLEESIAASQKVLQMAPTFAVAHNNLALAYFEKGEFRKAVAHCDQARSYGFSVDPRFLELVEPHRNTSEQA